MQEEVRFEEADALQAAFLDMFATSAAPKEALIRSLRQLEAAREHGSALDHLEYLEEPGGNVRIQTTYALAAASPGDLPTLLLAEDRDIRFSAMNALLFQELSTPVESVLAVLRQEESRFLIPLTHLVGHREEPLLTSLLQSIRQGEVPAKAQEAFWDLILEQISSKDLADALELALSEEPLAALPALSRHLGLSALTSHFQDISQSGLKAGFERAKKLFPDQPRIPRTLIRELAKGPSVETYQALIGEIQDHLYDVLDLAEENPGALTATLPPSLSGCYRFLSHLQVSPQATYPRLFQVALATFLRLWNIEFYQELREASLATPDSWKEIASLGRPDLHPLLAASPQAIPALKILLEDPTCAPESLFTWLPMASQAGLPVVPLALAALAREEIPERLLAEAMSVLSRHRDLIIPLRLDPGFPEWFLFRRCQDEEMRMLLDAEPGLAWALFDRLGVVAAVPRLGSFPEHAAVAPGLLAFVENLSSGDIRGEQTSRVSEEPPPPVSQEPASPSPSPSRPTKKRKRRRKRNKSLPSIGRGYTWSR
jgi:hypothetical protein